MKIVMACLIGLVLSVGAGAEPVVEGRVRLASGEAAVGAQVLVFDLADLSRYVRATTDASGEFVVSLGALGQGPGLPAGFGLGQNYPNPFNPGTVIPYELAAAGYVRLEVFNLLGQRVAVLVDGEMLAGSYTASWDGRDGSGQGVAAGVYIYRLMTGGGVATRRMVLVDGAGFGRTSTSSVEPLSPRGSQHAPWAGLGEARLGADAAGYGLTVSGPGVETYVDVDFRVGSGPVEVVVDAVGSAARGKAAAGGILGDVNNDGAVNVSDALLVTLYSGDSSTVMPNGGDISLGDVNGDGAVDATDAYLITLYSVDPNDPALPAGIGEPVVLAGGILGDVNGDGAVDAADALLVTLYSGDSSTAIPSGGDIGLGDVNGDGAVDATDAYLITLYSVDPTDSSLPAGIGEPVGGAVVVRSTVRSVVFILDLSGSMDDAVAGGGTRLEAAQAALAQVLASAPTDGSQEYALTTFGGGCDVDVPIGFTGNPQAVVSYASGVSAEGDTPLASALRQGQHLALDEASSDDVLLVLLSDGEETCNGDPVGVARSIGQGVRAKVNAATGTLAKVISVNAIGFGVEPGSAADQQIQAIAKETGGNYFRASETADLAVALGQASGLVQERVPTLSGQVTDAEGNPIQGALVQLRNLRENTDANGRYLFPAGVQGVDSLIVTAAGFARFEAEVYLFDVDKAYDVRLTVVEPSADRAALVVLYEATGGANWKDNTNWLSEEPLYEWYGVTTDEEERVFRLRLGNNGLTGSLPAELGQLPNLRELSLRGNDLSGSLPAEWGQLHNLRELDLVYNGLTGSLPVELGQLTNLRWLYLYRNELSGSLPAEWGQLHNLRELSLGNNDLSGSLPAEWGQLHNLTWLDLVYNGLTGSLPAEWGQLHNLTRLDLRGNDLSGSLPAEWGQLHNLTRLDLYRNDLSGSLPAEWGQLHNLRELDLRYNGLTGSLPAEWGQLHNLTRLSLGNNGLTGSLPAEWDQLPNLTWLDLDGDELTGCIPSVLGYRKDDLDDLGLSFCNIPPNDEGDWAVLVALYEATGGANWENNTNWLSEEPLYEWYGVTMDEEGRVFRLDLGYNELSGSLPVELGQLHNLRWLDLGYNGLTGSLPVELGQLTNLRWLDLGYNGLTGSLPVELGQLTNLTFLDLRYNGLTGSLPAEWGQLHNLTRLYLYRNELSGSLPAEWGQLHNLRELSLGYNGLTGSLPAEWGQLHNLRELSLGNNDLSGSLPAEWGQLHNLRELYLGNNGLTGSLPAEWGQLHNLRGLSLGNNGLTGSLPAEWGQLHNLGLGISGGPWLGGNELTGCIPRTLQYLENKLDALGLPFCR